MLVLTNATHSVSLNMTFIILINYTIFYSEKLFCQFWLGSFIVCCCRSFDIYISIQKRHNFRLNLISINLDMSNKLTLSRRLVLLFFK